MYDYTTEIQADGDVSRATMQRHVCPYTDVPPDFQIINALKSGPQSDQNTTASNLNDNLDLLKESSAMKPRFSSQEEPKFLSSAGVAADVTSTRKHRVMGPGHVYEYPKSCLKWTRTHLVEIFYKLILRITSDYVLHVKIW